MTCTDCVEEIYRWQDTKPTDFGGIRIGNNAMYDMTCRGASDNVRARYDDWRALVRRQSDMIRESCALNHN